jgi:hypothetical protein
MKIELLKIKQDYAAAGYYRISGGLRCNVVRAFKKSKR